MTNSNGLPLGAGAAVSRVLSNGRETGIVFDSSKREIPVKLAAIFCASGFNPDQKAAYRISYTCVK